MNTPAMLIIRDGKILKNGESPTKYLRNWQKKCKIVDGTLVNVIDRDTLQKLYNELDFLRSLSLCA